MKQIAIVIPAHNEEKVIKETIRSSIAIVGRANVYVIDDGSKDRTNAVAKKYAKNVFYIKKNKGKANALNVGIAKFKLTNRYKYIMPIDADTVVSPDFFKNILPILEKDTKNKIACVVGKVNGRNKKWITTYRLWEYEVNQSIHKTAQSMLGAISVCPGPSTVYRSRVFNKLKYSEHTMTEDMDFTFQIHRRRLGKIVFEPSACVTTQDPDSLRVYIKQLKRWYTGFWQCVMKHQIPWGGQRLDAEVALLATDSLLNVLLAIFFVLLAPAAFIINPKLLFIPVIIDFFVFMLPTILYVSIKKRMRGIIVFLPHFYLLRFVGSFIFFYSFLNVTLGLDISLTNAWNTPRYKILRKELWVN